MRPSGVRAQRPADASFLLKETRRTGGAAGDTRGSVEHRVVRARPPATDTKREAA